jgi:hypothetical protein
MSLRVLRRASAAIAVTSALIFGVGPIAAAPANAATNAHARVAVREAPLGYGPPVRLGNVYTGLCLDNTTPGRVRVIEAKCGAPGHIQRWRIYVHPGYVKIHLAINLAFCLNAVLGTGGVTIKLCRSDVHQNWFETHINTLFNTFENSANDKCLDGSRQYGVRVATCSHTNTHQWWS